MSITPSSPNLGKLKSFWERPEGKSGMIALAALAIGGVYGFSLLLPWLIALLQNTIYAVGLAIAVVAVLGTVTNKTFLALVGNSFRLTMRWLTGQLIELDPIGILQNNLDKMTEQSRELDKGVEGCAGAKKELETQIATNDEIIRHNKSLIDQADKTMVAERDPLRHQSVALRKEAFKLEIGRRIHSSENLSRILAQATRMYTMLTRWQALAQFNIINTTAEVQNAKQERNSILKSYRSMRWAERIIKGDPEQLKIQNAALEYLAEDNANKLGAMEDFSRYSEKFLTDMDIEQGASAADAEKMLAEYEQKLLSASAGETAPTSLVRTAEAVPVLRDSGKAVDGDYIDFKK
jgi:hypothetical protein